MDTAHARLRLLDLETHVAERTDIFLLLIVEEVYDSARLVIKVMDSNIEGANKGTQV